MGAQLRSAATVHSAHLDPTRAAAPRIVGSGKRPGSLRSVFTNQTHYSHNAAASLWSPSRPARRRRRLHRQRLCQVEPVRSRPPAAPCVAGAAFCWRVSRRLSRVDVAIAHSPRCQFATLELASSPSCARIRILVMRLHLDPEHPEIQLLYNRTQLHPPRAGVRPFPWPQRAIDTSWLLGQAARSRRFALADNRRSRSNWMSPDRVALIRVASYISQSMGVHDPRL